MRYWPLFIVLFIAGCIEPNQTFKKIPPGIWRGELLLDRTPVVKYGDDRDIVKKDDIESTVPFNFEVVYDNDSTFHIVMHNGTERINVPDVQFKTDPYTNKDTVIIDFPIYDTQIRAIYEDGIMEGDWIVNYRDDYRIPFKAVHGKGHRFNGVKREHSDMAVNGSWETVFTEEDGNTFKALGTFYQKGDSLTGTFQTETGDFRYLEGMVIEGKMYLSVFDGSHAYLFIAKMLSDSTLTGTFRAGSKYKATWEAKRTDKNSLADAYTMTKTTGKPLSFTFPNQDGQPVSITDQKFDDKYKIIQIMGTWCPNCMDETVFLQDYFKNHPADDIAVISIGVERYKDTLKSLSMLKKFKDRMHIDHDVLLGGYTGDRASVVKALEIDGIKSFPTLLFADRNNKIVKIHTGFNGPATPVYEDFKKEFTTILEQLRKD